MTIQVKNLKQWLKECGIRYMGKDPRVQIQRYPNGDYKPLVVTTDKPTDEQRRCLRERSVYVRWIWEGERIAILEY